MYGYLGKFKANPLISFLAKHAVGAPDKDAEPSAKRSAKSDSDADAADDEDEGADGKDKVIPQVIFTVIIGVINHCRCMAANVQRCKAMLQVCVGCMCRSSRR